MSNKRPAPDVEVNSTVVPDADDFKVIIITEVTNVAELDPTIDLNIRRGFYSKVSEFV